MPEDQTRFDEIVEGLDELKRRKPKDAWDKTAIVGQLIAGVFLVGL